MASKFNKYLNSAHKMAQRLSGAEAAAWKRRKRVVDEMEALRASPLRVKRMAKVTEAKRNRAWTKAGIGAAAVTALGVGAFRANTNRNERKLQERIQQLYNTQYS